jgi:hypothetical protein
MDQTKEQIEAEIQELEANELAAMIKRRDLLKSRAQATTGSPAGAEPGDKLQAEPEIDINLIDSVMMADPQKAQAVARAIRLALENR